MPVGPVGLAVLAVVAATVTGCASTAAHPGRPLARPRLPVLAACPATGSNSGLPALALPCLRAGAQVNPSRLGGSPILINLWASWCVPCQQEMPALQRAYARAGQQVRFLGVDTEDEVNSAQDFLAATGVHYPQAVDARGDLLHRIGGTGLPVTLVLDARGRVVFSRRGRLRDRDLSAALAAAR